MSLNLGRISGIKLTIHWTFIFIIVFIFYQNYRQNQDIIQGLWGVLFILVLFLCVVLHELGHALSARRYGIKTEIITLLPIGGLANMERMPEKPAQELWVALAGPLVNLVIAAVIYLGLLITNTTVEVSLLENGISAETFIVFLLVANVMLLLFNLIPAFPMDGGRVLRAYLAMNYPRAKATLIAARIGQLLAVGFIILGFYNNFFLILIGVFIFAGAGMEANFEATKSVLSGFKVKDAVMKNFTILQTTDTIAFAVETLLNGTEKNFLIFENDKLAGILTRDEIIQGLNNHGKELPIENVFRRETTTIDVDLPLQEAYQLLITNKIALMPVTLNNEIIGVIDLENVNEFLMINKV